MSKEWNGVCVCGKTERDGVRCKYGASHSPLIRPRLRRERLVDDDDDDALPLFKARPAIKRERL